MESFPLPLIYLIFAIVVSAFTAAVAASKGYDRFPWALGGFLFTFVALLAIIGMPMKAESPELIEDDKGTEKGEEKKDNVCKSCGAATTPSAKFCTSCGEALEK